MSSSSSERRADAERGRNGRSSRLTRVGAFFLAAVGILAASACSSDPAPVATDTKVKKVVSTGCSSSQNAPKGFMSQTKVQVHAEQRTYDWVIPDIHDGVHPIPLVFVFDGVTGKGASARASYPIEAAAGGQAAFVYPDVDATGVWDVEHDPQDNVDVAFYDSLLQTLETSYCIDTNRVFVTGFGNGGSFANQLGCFRGTDLRALAAHGGVGPQSPGNTTSNGLACPEKPIAALITHGSADTIVIDSDAQSTRDYWGQVNGCRTGGLQTFQTFAPCIDLLNCSSDRPVVYCEVQGLDHSLWQQAAPASWAFFNQL